MIWLSSDVRETKITNGWTKCQNVSFQENRTIEKREKEKEKINRGKETLHIGFLYTSCVFSSVSAGANQHGWLAISLATLNRRRTKRIRVGNQWMSFSFTVEIRQEEEQIGPTGAQKVEGGTEVIRKKKLVVVPLRWFTLVLVRPWPPRPTLNSVLNGDSARTDTRYSSSRDQFWAWEFPSREEENCVCSLFILDPDGVVRVLTSVSFKIISSLCSSARTKKQQPYRQVKECQCLFGG